MFPSLTVIVPGCLEARTGGYEYDRCMVAGLRARGWRIEVQELDASFPKPTMAALAQAARALAAMPDHATVLIDGLALGAMPAEVEHEAARLRIIALVHLPLAAEVGLDRETAAALEASERRALAAAAHVVVTGRETVEALAAYGVELDRMTVVEPGTNRARLSRGSAAGGPIELLCVATLNAGKGHEILIGALAAIRDRNWHLTCAGSLERDPATVERVRAAVARQGVYDRVSLAGELGPEDLEACYNRADVFVLATLKETYGMAVAEALAHGLPVISTSTGAIPDLVSDSAVNDVACVAGIVVPPGDHQALADALSLVLGDPGVRQKLADGARRVRERLPTWEDASGKMSAALGRIVSATESPLGG